MKFGVGGSEGQWSLLYAAFWGPAVLCRLYPNLLRHSYLSLNIYLFVQNGLHLCQFGGFVMFAHL